ncbi:MAG: hypothetical protein WDN31_18935 [Hyphomicrobium sp.]
MLALADMQGLWNRSLLVRPDKTRDTTTWVAWLQGPTLFVDLRQPAGRPSFYGVRSLGDLSSEQITWLAEQEGFAGRLEQDEEFFVWRRVLDFQPMSRTPDSGRLYFEGEIMVEEGRHSPYIEHWHREPAAASPCAAMQLCDRRGTLGFLVRAGETFMYARAGDSKSRPAESRLSDGLDEAASLEAARQLVDCEISFGQVSGTAWTIVRSSLPYREGARLDPKIDRFENRCGTADVAADGSAMQRHWDIMELEGDVTALGEEAEREAEVVEHS